MSDSDAAYAAALAAIRREIADDEPDLTFSFDEVEFRSLDRLPPEFEELPALQALSLDNTQVADLEPLRAFPDLQVLRFCNTRVADLGPIRILTSLRTLSLDNTPVADLAALQGLTSLQELSLARTGIADLAPVRTLTGLRTLSLNDTKFLTDLRPISELTSLVDGGLHYRGCAACALDPEGLGRLAEIEDNRERTELTLAYLSGLTVWPPVRPDPPEQDDLLRVAPNADGRLDVMPVRPGAAEAAEALKRTLYRRLREAFADLERAAGNYQSDFFRRARAAQDRLPEDFARADLVEV
jgi:hypothetical protein